MVMRLALMSLKELYAERCDVTQPREGGNMAKSGFVHVWMLTGIASALVAGSIAFSGVAVAQFGGGFTPRDPGVRGAPAGAGGPLPGLTAAELAAFNDGLEDFNEAEGVGDGLGPRFNL